MFVKLYGYQTLVGFDVFGQCKRSVAMDVFFTKTGWFALVEFAVEVRPNVGSSGTDLRPSTTMDQSAGAPPLTNELVSALSFPEPAQPAAGPRQII